MFYFVAVVFIFIYLFLIEWGLQSCSQTSSSCGAWASHCSGLSCCRAQALGCVGFSGWCTWSQELWCTGLVASRYVGSPQTRNQTGVLCLARWTLNCWTTRDAPKLCILNVGPFLFLHRHNPWHQVLLVLPLKSSVTLPQPLLAQGLAFHPSPL